MKYFLLALGVSLSVFPSYLSAAGSGHQYDGIWGGLFDPGFTKSGVKYRKKVRGEVTLVGGFGSITFWMAENVVPQAPELSCQYHFNRTDLTVHEIYLDLSESMAPCPQIASLSLVRKNDGSLTVEVAAGATRDGEPWSLPPMDADIRSGPISPRLDSPDVTFSTLGIKLGDPISKAIPSLFEKGFKLDNSNNNKYEFRRQSDSTMDVLKFEASYFHEPESVAAFGADTITSISRHFYDEDGLDLDGVKQALSDSSGVEIEFDKRGNAGIGQTLDVPTPINLGSSSCPCTATMKFYLKSDTMGIQLDWDDAIRLSEFEGQSWGERVEDDFMGAKAAFEASGDKLSVPEL